MKKFLTNLLCKTVLSVFIGIILLWSFSPESTQTEQPIVGPIQKTYCLTFSNGYKTSSDYYMTEERASLYVKLLNECPITLKIRTYKEYQKQYVSKVAKKYKKNAEKFAGKNTTGHHVMGLPVEGWPNHFIWVRTRPNPHELMGTYFHELGHNKCHTKRCNHNKDNLSEYHAIINEMKLSMKYDLPEVITSSFEKYEGWLDRLDCYHTYQEYADAVLKMQDSKLWDKVKDFSNKHHLKVPTFKMPTE
jgi:hypothetical protein